MPDVFAPGALGDALGWLASAALLLLPGAVALDAAGHPARGLERLALSVGTSLPLAPLALLYSGLLGLGWTAGGVRAAYALLAALALYAWLRRGRTRRDPTGADIPLAPDVAAKPGDVDARRRRLAPASAAALGVLVIGLLVRVWQVRGLALPAWVDGYHHSLIVELVLRAGAVPADFRPLLEVDRFYYHFGFHALAAQVSWLSGLPAPRATLVFGQALNAAAVLAAWLLALRLTGSRWAAAAAALVPASLFWFPAYYLSWGRYTQLAGLAALPAVLVLVAEGTAARGPRTPPSRAGRRAVLAALASAGLLLLHYRVFVFFLLACLLILADLVWGLVRRRAGARACLLRLLGIGGLGLVLVLPWLAGPFADGMRALQGASAANAAQGGRWYAWSGEVNAVPGWLFSIGSNPLWLALAAAGLLLGLLRRRRAAWALGAYLALAWILVHPARLGLPSTWTLPPFAAAIALYLPVALGVGLLAEAYAPALASSGARLAARLGLPRAAAGWLAAASLVALAAVGAWRMRDIRNPVTEIFRPPDEAAMAWIARSTPRDAEFLIRTAPWHLGTCRGLDGGYWIPLLTGRGASMPASFYAYGAPARVEEITQVCALASLGDAISDAELDELLARTGATWAYVGPAEPDNAAGFSAERLRQSGRFETAWEEEGASVLRRTR